MPQLNTIRRLTIVGETRGVNEATASVRQLGSATTTLGSTTDSSARRQLSLNGALERSRRSMDAAYRASRDLARGQDLWNRALRTGQVSAAEHSMRLNQLAARYREVGLAQTGAMAGMARFGGLARTALGGLGIGIGAGLLAEMTMFARRAGEAVGRLDNLGDAATKAGVGVEKLQVLRFAISQNEGDIEDADRALIRFNRTLGEFVLTGGGPGKAAFQALALSVKDSGGNLRSTESILDEAFNKLSRVTDASQRAAVATRLFGREQGPIMSALLGQGVDAIDGYAARMNKFTQEEVQRADVLDKKYGELAQRWDVIWTRMAISVSEGAFSIIDKMGDIQKAADSFFLGPNWDDFIRMLGEDPNQSWRGFLFGETGPMGALGRTVMGKGGDATTVSGLRQQLDGVNSTISDINKQIEDVQKTGVGLPLVAGFREQLAGMEADAARVRGLMLETATISRNPFETERGTAAEPFKLRSVKDDEKAAKEAEKAAKDAARERKAAADQAERERKAVSDRIDQLRFENRLIGQNAEEQAVANELRRAGAAATARQREEIEALTRANFQATEAQKKFEKAQADAISRMDEFRGTAKSVIGSLLEGDPEGALERIRTKLLDITENMITGALFGGQGEMGGGLFGDIVQNILGKPTAPVASMNVQAGIVNVSGLGAGFPVPGGPTIPSNILPGTMGAPPSSGAGGAGWLTAMSSVSDIERYITQAAAARGIDPDIAVRVAKSEGLAPGVWQSNVMNAGVRETSYGPYQLLTGGGLGDVFKSQTGLNPADPSTVQRQIDFALDQARQGGWGPWYGAAKAGIGKWEGINRNAPIQIEQSANTLGASLEQAATVAAESAGGFANVFPGALQNVVSAIPGAPGGGGGGIGGLFSGLFGGGESGASLPPGGLFAAGGLVRGPGSSTSDSIPARLSDGEYVVRAAAVREHRDLLDAINFGAMARFADGGPVGMERALEAGRRGMRGGRDGGVRVELIDQRGANAPAVEQEEGMDANGERFMRFIVRSEMDKAARSGKFKKHGLGTTPARR